MNRTLSTALIAVLLCACKPATAPALATDTAAPPATQGTASAATAVASTAAAPPASAVAPTAAGTMPADDVGDSAGTDAVNQSIDTVLGDHAKYEPVIHAFQQAVASGDKQGVAALVDYPISVTIDGKATSIKDAQAFVAGYDRFMTPAIARAISAQKYADLFVNDKGVMFGNGEAWINGVCRDTACKDMDVKVVALQPGTE